LNKSLINLKLAYLRKVKHMTQEELAEVIGTLFQTISKWENGVTMPDISVLPVLADFFNVSVDQLLGIKPLDDEEYISDGTDTRGFWDNHLEYLIRTRSGTWNADYMRFLVRDVWKINKPVRVLDCGCGFGYIAVLLMPCLPEGSTYTGIDFSASMTKEASVYLKKHGVNGTVINGDFITFDPKDKYDMVICKSVLRHLGDSEPFIRKMIECADNNALIVCADSNREIECCGLYIDGLNYGYLCDHEGAIKHWQTEIDNGKRDYAAAMRSAYVMRKLGLSDVDVRMNDRVSFIYPEQADYDEKISDFLAHKESWYDDTAKAIERLVNHGMTPIEAEKFVYKSSEICEYVRSRKGEVALTQFKGETITYGWNRSNG